MIALLIGLLSVAVIHPNILYLVIDDMRPQMGSYGHQFMKTPNLDNLASQGTQFMRAYTQFAYCAPSRNSFMSGRRPDRTRALNFLTTFRDAPGGQSWVTMPQYFKNKGYFTSSAGKVFHDGMDDPISWTYPSNQTRWYYCSQGDLIDDNSNFCGITEYSINQLTDEDLAINEGIKRLEMAINITVETQKPFWVSIGLHRPHVPYRVPRGFWGSELYPYDTVLPPVDPSPPNDVPFVSNSWMNGDILDPQKGCGSCIVPTNRSTIYRSWYYASVTYSDHIMGKALSILNQSSVANNTIVVFHSDHGYHLGEQNEWSKKVDTELGTHVPLIIKVPWKKPSKTYVLAELVDMYKTLVDLCGFEEVQNSVQGTSLAPVFDDPTALSDKRAFSQIARCDCNVTKLGWRMCNANACVTTPQTNMTVMGYTMRTDQYRYTAWYSWNTTTLVPNVSDIRGEELYNLTDDRGVDFDLPAYRESLVNSKQYSQILIDNRQYLSQVVGGWNTNNDSLLKLIIEKRVYK
eukprot:TRINITY_DN20212_c0_g1_i1.p1 TRINITY_DN20212_c0_g1~~TRINITY_DN20212_c0_g1_i1.p1  ORF type:complete len:529 (+),score=62.29 TRINITY_DN20212_c0_g1_i1:36-1589(+)